MTPHQTDPAGRAHQTPRALRRRIRQRAWSLARHAYEAYCAEIAEAVDSGRLPADRIADYTPERGAAE